MFHRYSRAPGCVLLGVAVLVSLSRAETPASSPADLVKLGGFTSYFPIPPSDPSFRYVGRFDRNDANCYRFAWSACQIQFRFTGHFAVVLLEDAASGGPSKVRGNSNNYFNVVVDDRPPAALPLEKGRSEYFVAEGLSDGEHTVTLFRRTEPLFNETRFRGIRLEGRFGKLLPPPPAPKRLIEFIGDSITAGYGNEANDAKDGFCQATENNYLAYGAITARNLSADYVCLAWSGQGVFRDRQGKTDKTLPVLYHRALPADANSTWDFRGYKADVVVINLGTNDFAATAPPKEDFLKAYRGLVETVWRKHPGAHVFCCVGPMMQDNFPKDSPGLPTIRAWLTEMVAEYVKAGHKDVHYVEFDRQDHRNGLGSNYHPSLKTHRILADKLTEAIKKEMGWAGAQTLPAQKTPTSSPAARPTTMAKVGEEAPDFELPRLEIGAADANGVAKATISEKTVRLSSFRGKRPVVLIFSSYT